MINKKILIILLFSLITTTINAKGLNIPSKAKIIRMIKNNKYPSLSIVGLNSFRNCDSVSIRNIKILKILNGSKSYRRNTGEYLGSGFRVKIKATGTCTFSKFHNFYKDLDGDGRNDYIAGTLPIINEPLNVQFSGYKNNWYVSGIDAFTSIDKPYIKNQIKRIFLKGKRATGDRYVNKVIINNIPKGSGNGKYQGQFALSNKRYAISYRSVNETEVRRIFGTKYRPADWNDLLNYSKNRGSVSGLFRRLGIGASEGVLVALNSYRFGELVAVSCTRYDKSKYFMGRHSKKLGNENICLAYTHRRPKNRFLAYNKSGYTQKSQNTYKSHKRATRQQKRSSTKANKTKNEKKVKELLALFQTRPKALRIFKSKDKATRFKLFQYMYDKKTKAERKKAFLYVANGLESGRL